jgi:CubicO group peptidase (beta-lactamase class C family)
MVRRVTLPFAVLLLSVSGLDPRVQQVVDVLGVPDCPQLFGRLTPEFQKAVPRASWPAFCNGVGALKDLSPAKAAEPWLAFRAQGRGGRVRFEVAFTAEGLITGLKVAPDDTPAMTTLPLEQALRQVRTQRGVPALGVLIQRGDRTTTAFVTGVRKDGDPTPATLDDAWHLGSDTKAMTATLVAMFVDEKKLKWSSTVAEVLSDWKDLAPDFRTVTLEQLLTHRSGLPPNFTNWPSLDRQTVVHEALKVAPGPRAYLYSNLGYMVAGVMLEKVSGQTWEALMQQRLFGPLGMKRCGFGPPSTPGQVDAPWGHERRGAGWVATIADNPVALGPAGTVHCPLVDWAKFVALHLDAERGRPTLLSAASARSLHAAPGPLPSYASGWSVASAEWAQGLLLTHNGSNTTNYARVTVAPGRDGFTLVVVNAGDASAEAAVNDAAALANAELTR